MASSIKAKQVGAPMPDGTCTFDVTWTDPATGLGKTHSTTLIPEGAKESQHGLQAIAKAQTENPDLKAAAERDTLNVG